MLKYGQTLWLICDGMKVFYSCFLDACLFYLLYIDKNVFVIVVGFILIFRNQ